MALKKSEKRLLLIAGLVAAAFLFDKFVLGKKTKSSGPAPKSRVTVATNQSSVVQGNVIGQSSLHRVVYDDWDKDPFRVKEEKKQVVAPVRVAPTLPPIPEATLHGIFWKQGKGYVLINDDVMSEGEIKNGIRVDRIENQRVLCNYAGQSFTLYWRETL